MSVESGILERMFDELLRHSSDAAVVAAIEDWAAAEARAAARRLAAIAELVRRRCGVDDRARWACDSWDATAAEVSAALSIMHGRASGQMHLSQALCHRLPKVAALFTAGRLSYRMFAAIAWRTDLVQDDEAIASIDSAIAGNFGTWGPLSDHKLEQAIDCLVDRVVQVCESGIFGGRTLGLAGLVFLHAQLGRLLVLDDGQRTRMLGLLCGKDSLLVLCDGAVLHLQ